MKNFNGLSEEKVDELILNYLTTNKFQSSLNSLIISTLSQKKNMSLDRDGLANQIISHQYIKDVENEILQNLFEAFDIENYDTNELINLKYKSIVGSNQNTLSNQSLLNANSPLNSVVKNIPVISMKLVFLFLISSKLRDNSSKFESNANIIQLSIYECSCTFIVILIKSENVSDFFFIINNPSPFDESPT